MRYGRLTQTAWQRSVRRQLHKRCENSIFAPTPWENTSGLAGRNGECFLWADACASGFSARIGYYAVLKAAGDLAAKGVCPSCVSVRIFFPPEAEEEALKDITAGVEDACSRLDMQVTSLQGETTCAAAQTIVSVTAAGRSEKQETCPDQREVSAGEKLKAAPEQEIVFCGYAGLEGTLRILDEAREELGTRFVSTFLDQASRLAGELVIPEQILALFEEQNVKQRITAVCQVGSGGILAALWELSETLHTGFQADMSGISIKQETVEICEFYRMNPYQLTSAGSFLIVTEDAQAVMEILEKAGARAGRLGVTKAQNARVITSGEEIRYLDRPAPDELALWHAGRQAKNHYKNEQQEDIK